MKNNIEHCSKRLAYVLRHSEDVTRSYGGWVEISDVIRLTKLTSETISEVVLNDKKGRFEIDCESGLVRALYGHSVKVDMDYKEALPPETLLHGTSRHCLDGILSDGINPRRRQYVHLTDDLDVATDTGGRHGEVSVLNVDAYRMHAHGFKFYNPVPHIWLVSSVPAQYIEQYGDMWKEITELFVNQKTMCVVALDRDLFDAHNYENLKKHCDFCHISEYKADNEYRLTIVFVNEFNDYQSYKEEIANIRQNSDDFILFYSSKLDDNLNLNIPYVRTAEHPNIILKSLYDILFSGYPLPINYTDFRTFLFSDEKNVGFSRYKDHTNKPNNFHDYIRNVTSYHHPTKILLHFAIPTSVDDTKGMSDCIIKSIRMIPNNVEIVWGCSYTDEKSLSVVVFYK